MCCGGGLVAGLSNKLVELSVCGGVVKSRKETLVGTVPIIPPVLVQELIAYDMI